MEKEASLCPCGSGQSYQDCCAGYHAGAALPERCEALMRSRFSAFVLLDGDYLFNTHHPDFRGDDQPADFVESARQTRWLKLEVRGSQGGALDTEGWVDFSAWFMQAGKVFVHREHSLFCRDAGRWLYTRGEYGPAELVNIGRNDLCPCGSEIKFKKCCG